MSNPVGVPLARGITAPLEQLWTRKPNSVRRTATLSALPGAQWSGFAVEGVARDAAFGADRQLLSTRTGRLVAQVGEKGSLESVEVTDETGTRSLTEDLRGMSIGAGFRAQLARLEPPIADSSLVGSLLDDLSGLRHIAGYGFIVSEPQIPGMLANSPQVGTCAGWMAGGVAAMASSESILGDLPHAPIIDQLLADELDWHRENDLATGSMQRRRLLDVLPLSDGTTDLHMWFRDSLHLSDDFDGALHEYVVRASLDAQGLLSDAKAEPRSLPMGDCPLAASHVGLLEGRPVSQIDEGVRAHLRSELGCTHLNDAMRFLRSATPMLHQLSESEAHHG
ncbi:MAG: DUF2889 domain-containing protein [Actinomycetota bacterium]|nr:DUF2889 domain-containing protein [Actinomycetota bacterium]